MMLLLRLSLIIILWATPIFAQEMISNTEGDHVSAILDEELRKLRRDIPEAVDSDRLLPSGGNQHYALVKATDADYDVIWMDINDLTDASSTGQCIGACNACPFDTTTDGWYVAVTDAAYIEMNSQGGAGAIAGANLPLRFKKTTGITRLVFYIRVWSDAQPHTYKLMINGVSSDEFSSGATEPTWSGPLDIDVSGCADGTVYQVTAWVKHNGVGGAAYCSSVQGFNHD